jgi:hypothetical protein
MSNFTKIFGLAGALVVFTGLANAQPSTCAAAAPATNIVRAEGTTEQVAPLVINCAGTGVAGTVALQVFLSPSLPITSKVLSTSTGATEAIATVSGSATQFNASVSGSTLNFSGIVIPAGAFSITVNNVRVNTTSVAVGSGVPPTVSATAFVNGSAGSITPAALSFSNIAFIQNGLGAAKVFKTFKSTGAFPQAVVSNGGANNFVICNPYSPASDGVALSTVGNTAGKSLAFVVQVNENFASSFKNVTDESSTVPTTLAANTVNDGTRIAVTFTNVPANATLYVPTVAIPSTDGNGAIKGLGTIRLTTVAPGTAFATVSASGSGSINSGTTNISAAAVSVSSGTGTATFEVITDDPNVLDSYSIPVFIVTSANAVAGSSTPISVAVSFAPVGSTVIPNFVIAGSTTTLTGSTFNLCTTSLLFPFVTNQVGFDTGIAISNTSTDPFGGAGATAQAGTCTLNFYGAGAPSPSNVVSPNVPSGTTYATVLSSVAAGFQGYIIAQCGFQYAHGFAFITDGVGVNGGLSQGYLAGIIPDTNQTPRGANPLSVAAPGTGETLGN